MPVREAPTDAAGPCVDARASWSATICSRRSPLSSTRSTRGAGERAPARGPRRDGQDPAPRGGARRGPPARRAACCGRPAPSSSRTSRSGWPASWSAPCSGELPEDARRAFLAEAPGARSARWPGARADLPEPDEPTDLTVSHGLFALMAGAAETRPTLLAIDDLHWGDVASLEFVLYLLHRLDELPVALVHDPPPRSGRRAVRAARPDLRPIPGCGSRASRRSGSRPSRSSRATRSASAPTRLWPRCRSRSPAATPSICTSCCSRWPRSPGASGAELTRRARALAPDAVTRSLRVRVGRLGPDAGGAGPRGGDPRRRRPAAPRRGAGRPRRSTRPARPPTPWPESRCCSPASRCGSSTRSSGTRSPRTSRRSIAAAGTSTRPGCSTPTARTSSWSPRTCCSAAPAAIPGSSSSSRGRRARGPGRHSRPCATSSARSRSRRRPSCAPRSWPSSAPPRPRSATPPPPSTSLRPPAGDDRPPPARRAGARARARALDAQGRHEEAARVYDNALSELPADTAEPEELELRDQLEAGFITTASIVPDLQPRRRRALGTRGRARGQGSHAPRASGCCWPRRRSTPRPPASRPTTRSSWPSGPGTAGGSSPTPTRSGSGGGWSPPRSC